MKSSPISHDKNKSRNPSALLLVFSHFVTNVGDGHCQILSLLYGFSDIGSSKNVRVGHLVGMIFIFERSICDRSREVLATLDSLTDTCFSKNFRIGNLVRVVFILERCEGNRSSEISRRFHSIGLARGSQFDTTLGPGRLFPQSIIFVSHGGGGLELYTSASTNNSESVAYAAALWRNCKQAKCKSGFVLRRNSINIYSYINTRCITVIFREKSHSTSQSGRPPVIFDRLVRRRFSLKERRNRMGFSYK